MKICYKGNRRCEEEKPSDFHVRTISLKDSLEFGGVRKLDAGKTIRRLLLKYKKF